jgi:3-oxoacid CoA-transferase subunit B
LYAAVNRCKLCKKIVTELAVIEVTPKGFRLLERAPGVTIEEIKSKTAGKLMIEMQCRK